MLSQSQYKRPPRGIVLVLVLAMLGLLALVGVTFATFAGQSRINSRNFAQSLIAPQDDELMDFALSQLINDTGDPRSAIRGHSLARDMYGGDANTNYLLTNELVSGTPLSITGISTVNTSGNAAVVQLTTNIPVGAPAYYGYVFTRWIVRVSYIGPISTNGARLVDQTLEVINDVTTGTNRAFQVAVGPYITNHNINTSITPTPPTPVAPYTMTNHTMTNPVTATAGTSTMGAVDALLYNNPTGTNAFALFSPANTSPDTNYQNLGNYVLTLDSRWLNAFNGTGMQANAIYGNFRYNGLSPASSSMDEDYDACDLENWFLAIQSADAQIIIPSFHRPGNVRFDTTNGVNDWTRVNKDNGGSTNWSTSAARILRPVAADGNDPLTFPDLTPNTTTSKISYDVDNDGDGINDSVWLDLGYPVRRDSRGQLYKPLFAFMVIGLNGKIPLNTAGNLAGSSSGNGSTHAAHLGNSVSEVDPTYALQNAFDSSGADQAYAFTIPILPPPSPTNTNPDDSQVDSGGIDVRLTQLRNLLTGTRPQLNPTPTTLAQYPQNVDPNGTTNGDDNYVLTTTGAGAGNPYFMPNGIAELSPIDAYTTTYNDANGNPQVLRITQPVAGRWGEAQSIPGVPFVNSSGTYINLVNTSGYHNPVRAGYSLDIGDIFNGIARDAADDNYNSFDFYPTYDSLTGLQRIGEVDDSELYDPAGAILLPIDRIRRFLTPIDINGTGSIRTFTVAGAGPPSKNAGPDAWGRIEYYSYFRPPGAPGTINVNYNPADIVTGTSAPLQPMITGTSLGAVYYPSASITSFYTVGLPPGQTTPLVTPSTLAYIPDLTNNPLHCFEFFKLPNMTGAYGGTTNTRPGRNYFDPQDFGGMPADLHPTNTGSAGPPVVPPNPIPTAYPTYNFSVNSQPSVLSDGLNEADEMNLYTPNPLLDSPFGPGDLEWLYRQQDVDGASLTSRLSKLAPISFGNAVDSPRRRRLFALDAWETNNFVWANDNPGNVFPNNSTFSSNPSATGTDPASGATVNIADASFASYGAVNNVTISTPALAHRDKKINLNYPLPVSNDPNEPVRQKWINDTYYLLKRILPPRAVDTPEELAQLSQFIVNIIDFRDPDCTMTHYQNPDVVVALGSISAGVGGNTFAPPVLYAGATVPTGVTTLPLDQYGMEYNPIAINEAMAFSFLRKVNTAGTYSSQATPRFFVELVNTLTQANLYGLASNAATIDLGNSNYDLVITNDDPVSRPDPFMGQLLPIVNTSGSTTVFGPIPLVASSFNGATTNVMTTALPAATGTYPTGYFNVIANASLDTTSEVSPVTATQKLQTQFDPTDTTNTSPTGVPPTPAPGALTLNNTTAATIGGSTIGVPNKYPAKPWMATLGSASEAYYWICLRRPASLFLPPNPDPTGSSGTYNPMIVVDAMRFPYIEGGGTVQTIDQTGGSNDVVTIGTNAIYSTQRAQPYRGGHAVRLPTDTGTTTLQSALNTTYGYSEQSSQPATQTSDYGQFGTKPITSKIYHTLGLANDQAEPWDWFMFHDRDFTSVAELMFVPGCPPGLFTKQFVELPPMPPMAATSFVAPTGFYTNFPVPGATAAQPAFTFPPPSPPLTPIPPNSPGPTPTLVAATAAPTAPNAYVYIAPAAGPVQPHTYPYLVDKFFYSGASLPAPTSQTTGPFPGTDTAVQSVNTASSDGWFKMFEFFEVPSQMIGAIGPVANGTNFDWARQDFKPGLINLNLVIDEEVFFSVLGKQSYSPANVGVDRFTQTLLNFSQLMPSDAVLPTSNSSAATAIPLISTAAPALPANGPTYSYQAWALGQSGGVMTGDWLHPQNGTSGPPSTLGYGNNAIKAAFAQFLTLRHGGTGVLFGFNGERPFHSLSYPDIDYTVMRPATLPPTSTTANSPPISNTAAAAGVPYATASYAADPGVRNVYLYPGSFVSSLATAPTGFAPGTPFVDPTTPAPNTPNPPPNVALPEPVPARRLFQVPDAYGQTVLVPANTTITTPPTIQQSNASDAGDPFINVAQTNGALPAVTPSSYLSAVPAPAFTPPFSLNNGYPSLVWSGNVPAYPGTGAGTTQNQALGSTTGGAQLDYRQHPNWRLEMMQRVMNLTTVRTHQYAVWITVGFFEVTRQGDITQLAQSNPIGAFDVIGAEVGAVTGKSVRFRGFFLVDRTKLTGFNPNNTGSFRQAVVYRKVIQ